MIIIIPAERYFREANEMFRELRPRKSEGVELLKKASQLGHRRAKAMIAWETLFGTELAQNITAAKETFEELAGEGVAEAQTVL